MSTNAELKRYVPHKTLKAEDLSPTVNPSFSPNLYRWMQKKGYFFENGGSIVTAYRVKATAKDPYLRGVLWIGFPVNGYPGDADFIGARLISVLCNGVEADTACYVGLMRDLEPIPDFWDNYQKIGRCAIDPQHETEFRGNDRYLMNGDLRTCRWCGHVQHRQVMQKVVETERWHSAA